MKFVRYCLLTITLVLTSACGGDGGADNADAGDTPPATGTGTICQSPTPPPQCSRTCTSDSSCTVGYYCGADGFCTADCAASGEGDCEAAFCNSRGRCEAAPIPDAGPECNKISLKIEPIIPTVQLLIDHSASMDQDFGNQSRVQAVREALLDADDGVVASLQSDVRFGATLYTSFDGNQNPPCPQLTKVAPGLNNYQAIDDEIRDDLRNSNLGEDTPTGESIAAVAAEFPPPGPNDRQIIVLATDGDPDTCIEPDPQDISDPDESEAEAQKARDQSEAAAQQAFEQRGIETYVLSVGNDVTESHLQRLANAGVGKAFDEQSEPATVYKANNQEELTQAFNDIIRGARECRFTLNATVTDPTGGEVTLNGQTLEYPQDWRIVGGNTLELLGTACQTYLTEDVVELDAIFDCDSVSIE